MTPPDLEEGGCGGDVLGQMKARLLHLAENTSGVWGQRPQAYQDCVAQPLRWITDINR